MICPACAAFRPQDVGAECPTCGVALVSPSEPHLEELVRTRLRHRIDDWREREVIDARTAVKLRASLETPPAESPAPPPRGSAPDVEKWADEVAGSLQRLASWRPGWGAAFFQAMEEAAKAEREAAARQGARGPHPGGDSGAEGLGLAMNSGGALFSSAGAGALGAGLEAMVALDASGDARGREGSLKLHEYVWWFLGALLVLGGSLMGVREAWRALGGVPRQLIVTGALFVYHAGFIGLGVFLGRRSLSAGRVLAGIGLALLPVVFVALAALTAMAPGVGVAGAFLVSGLGLLTLRAAGRLLHGASVGSLAVALFPSLLAGLPLMWLGEEPWPRVFCAFAGVVAVAASLWRSEKAGQGMAPLVSVGVALYGALALALFAITSAPEGFDSLEPGSPTFAGMVLWAVALAAVVAGAATREAIREAYPRAAPVLEVLAHAVLAGGVLAGAASAFALVPGDDPWVDLVSALTPAAAALAFFLLEPRRRALVHLGVLAVTLTGFLLARAQMPGEVAWWCVGSAAVASGLMLVARQCERGSLRLWLLGWGVVLSLASMPLVSVATWISGQGSAWPKFVTGTLVAVAAHLAAGHRWRSLHYLGGVAVPFAMLAALIEFPLYGGDWATVAVFTLGAALYGGAALLHGGWARRSGGTLDLSPLDDLSLVGASLAVVLLTGLTPVAPEALGVSGVLGEGLLSCAPTVLASALLLLRARRDRSRLVSFLAALGGVAAAMQFCRFAWDASDVRMLLVAPALVLGLAVISAGRGRGLLDASGAAEALRGRKMFGGLPLPFPETGRPLFTDGFASAALLVALYATLPLIAWISNPVATERSTVLLASGLLVGSALLTFFSRGFVAWRLRGSVVALAASGGLIVLTSQLNRAGRPLPPDVTAWRLPLIGVALWGLALVARRFGPWLARKLENEPQGRLYHFVPHAGVAALILVLMKGPFQLVGLDEPSRALGLVPPLMPLGAALLSLLLAASFRRVGLVHLGLLIGLQGAGLWAAQQALLGPELVAMPLPDGPWVRAEAVATWPGLWWEQPEAWLPPGATRFLLWQRAFAGIAAAGLVYAAAALLQVRAGARLGFLRRLLSQVQEELREVHAQSLDTFRDALPRALRRWATLAAVLVFAASFFLPGVPSAALVLGTGVVLFLSGARSQGRIIFGAGVLLLVHAVAHLAPVVAAWPGPLLAAVALAMVLLAPWVARRRGLNADRVRLSAHLAATLYALAGTVYALAAGGRTERDFAVPRLLEEALTRLDGRWMLSPAFPVTVALVAALLLVGAFQWRGALASVDALAGTVLAGFAAVCGLSVVMVAREGWQRPSYEELVTAYGAALAMGAAVSATLVHAAGQWLRERRLDVTLGLRWGRDVWLLGCGGLLTLVALLLQSPEADTLPQALAALGLTVLVCLHCAWSEHTGRHVYFVQVAVVGVYALVRALFATDLRPEHDALFALVLGFALVGVTVLARRAGIPPVANATRRFAALLPLLVWAVLPSEATGEAALLAGGSGLLYAAIGAVEHSRWFGSLAAAACNLALLIAALSYGLDGLEVYLAPLGLLLLMLAQLFSHGLPQAARNAVRLLGGFLLYVPAAAKLSLQVGLAADGTYALIFGGACLLGVAVGMALHIRAYLALGTLFLTLDVVANLVHAGLRDHRVGFVVMTLTGLAIVGGRVLATLRRQQLEALMRSVRVQLRGWD
ncbi:hypothetical protein [Hyalangium rubrum]|uniref:DUF2157 domain-containing protein n=1 Tax=Hyalangium rubrum TaxID=3103134 RepID=A0ABU5H0P5_9BACT|nr:hypothetical protein [Hyalangium sp. s54d21]MDY7225670.1 hypothetical protein [Hyalangium sp. s54d21]